MCREHRLPEHVTSIAEDLLQDITDNPGSATEPREEHVADHLPALIGLQRSNEKTSLFLLACFSQTWFSKRIWVSFPVRGFCLFTLLCT